MWRDHGERIEGVERIAVLRANGIGDLVFALPALDALRATYPRAEIVLLGLDWHAALLAGRPGPVDRVEPVPPAAGVSVAPDDSEDRAAQDRFFARMEAERFDLALQLHGGGRWSNPFVRRLGARVTAGLHDRDVEPLDRSVPYVYLQHEVLRLLEVVGTVGAEAPSLEPHLDVTAADLREAGAALAPRHLLGSRPLAVLVPGAGDRRRRWPPEGFAAVASALAACGAAVAIAGSADDRELAQAVTRATAAAPGAGPIDLTGTLSLGGLAGLLSSAAVVVSNDTGPLHIAQAVGAATVAIFWAANLINAGAPSRTRHRPMVSWRLDCPVCGRQNTHSRCEHDASFVADVPTDDVVAQALDLLRRERSPGTATSPPPPQPRVPAEAPRP